MSLAGRNATRPSTPPSDDWDDAAWIAQRMVLDAGAEAARLRRQASVQAASICEVAQREAEIVWQQASVLADAMREAAEREAAQLRATVMKLSAAPGEVVSPVSEPRAPVGKPGAPVGKPGAPVGKPGAPVGKPGIRTAGKPTATPETEPGTRSAGRPRRPPRQVVAVRVAAAATAALLLSAVAAGTTELALHGFAFFIFRQAGTGETNPSGLQEDQGPGQPDAPKPMPSSHRVTAKPAQRGHGERRQ